MLEQLTGEALKRREFELRLEQVWTFGYEARYGNKPLDGCPHVGEEGDAWREGWRSADDGLARGEEEYEGDGGYFLGA